MNKFKGIVEQIIKHSEKSSTPKVLLINVTLNGGMFRDHVWITLRDKDINKIRRKDNISFTGDIVDYICSNNINKKGIRCIRNLEILKED